jgi:hypothetical protein
MTQCDRNFETRFSFETIPPAPRSPLDLIIFRACFTEALLYFTFHAQSILVRDVIAKLGFEARHHLEAMIVLTPFWWAACAAAMVYGMSMHLRKYAFVI